jgi:hypothetical protein
MSFDPKNKIDDSDMSLRDYSNLLDKLVEFNKPKEKSKKYLLIICEITLAIISIIITVFVCIIIYKTNISVEGIISFLLAFFSIFISVLFYIKASDTSTSFYERSYDIMKDVSVSLGKIEERFGERLNSMNDTLSLLSFEKVETKKNLQHIDSKKDELINELVQQLDQKGQEQEEYKKRLNELNEDANLLKNKLISLESVKNSNLDLNFNLKDESFEKYIILWFNLLGENDKSRLMNGARIFTENKDAYKLGMRLGLIDEMGFITTSGKSILNHININ